MSSVPVEAYLVNDRGRRPSWFRFPRSFRGLVTAWNTLTILVFTVTILVGLRIGLRYLMLLDEDKLLAENTTELGLILDRVAPRPDRWEAIQRGLDRKAESYAERKWFGVILSNDGAILAQTQALPDIQIPSTKGSGPLEQTVGSFRTLQRRHLINGAEPVVILVGSTTDEITDDVERLTELIVVAGLLLLIFAPLGGFWLAGRVIRPLAAVISSTANLRPSNISERLPIRNTGDELDQLSITINGLLDRIADYLNRHRDLTANAAHELRSPLTAILSSAEVALHQDRSVEEYKDLLGSIVEECTRLGTLVQQLLLLSESDAGRLEKASNQVPLDQLARRAADMFLGVAESRGIRLEFDAPHEVLVLGDAGYLKQVIFNLIDNALKFTCTGFVRIEVRADDQKNALLLVTDSGIGIPAKNLPYVFDRFYRGDHARTRLATGSSGLGLSICKALVTASGGAISITSEVGRGTEVRVTLPVADCPPPITETKRTNRD
jgi:two-component system, OmpR family, heavy metal sensor histidine kinase CusS